MLLNQMPDGFALHQAVFDAGGLVIDYRFLAVNPAFEEMTGLSAKELIGKTVREVLPPTEGRWTENCGNVVLTGQPLRFEGNYFHRDRFFEVQAYRPQDGQIACIFRDITQQKTSQAEIEARLEKAGKTVVEYNAMFEGALEGILRTTPDGRILAANPAMSKMFGYDFNSPQPACGSSLQLWAEQGDRSPFVRLVEEQGYVQGHECRFRRRNGKIVWVSLTCRKVIGADEKTAYYEGFIDDITARKEIEQKLKTSENKFKMAFMTGAHATCISTVKNGVILEVNDRFTDLFGYTRAEACGTTSDQLGWFADGDRDRLISELAAHGRVEEMEFQVRRKNGQLRSMLVSASPFESDGDDLLLSVVRDVTEQKRAGAERVKLEEQFLQAQKLESVGRMAGGIAHDFNNQLTVINGYSDLLLRGCKSGDASREWVDEIRKAGERAVNLVRQLLAFSRKQIFEPKPLYLHQLVSENESMLRRLIGEDIDLDIHPGESEWPVMADPGQLHQVLLNLAVNARDAMPHGGKLTIRTANAEVDEESAAGHPGIEAGSYVSLRVSDTGAGIAKEIQARIFDPFFTTKEPGVGTGLGLSTVYGIVRQLGGSIAMRSEPGHGAEFEIYLPRFAAEVVRAVETPGITASAGGSETILVVEDQDPVRNLIVVQLKERGYQVLEAANGPDARLLAEHYVGPIHLLITDVVMPHMTGKELADRLRPVRQEMKVLYMSGYAPDVLARRGLTESGGSYIAKPFAREALEAKVRELLESLRSAASILVVDDEEGVRGYFQHVLTGAGYETVVARDGAEALKCIQDRKFDLLLTDLVMPEQEGLELIMILRKQRPDLKLVAVSGAYGGTFLEAAKAMGVSAALLKPVLADQLIATVRSVLS
jgi:two-component system cell cycle sensor histidine kinase/response regulator CckA